MTSFMVNLSSRVVKMCGYVCKKKAKQFDVYMMYIFYHNIVPIGSMYGIFTYIWLIFMVYVGKSTSRMDPMGLIYAAVVFDPSPRHCSYDSGEQ